MPESARPIVKINQTLLEKVLPQTLGKLIIATLEKLKDAWLRENVMKGIQFYSEMED